jgi:hypothetical protein
MNLTKLVKRIIKSRGFEKAHREELNKSFGLPERREIYNVCDKCGLEANRLTCLKRYGKRPLKDKFYSSTYHEGDCDVCGKHTSVTEVRDFYSPDFSLLNRIKEVCPPVPTGGGGGASSIPLEGFRKADIEKFAEYCIKKYGAGIYITTTIEKFRSDAKSFIFEDKK